MSVMTPEEFDRIVKNKIEELTSMPDLDYTEDVIWQKVYSKIKMRSFGFPFLWIGIFLMIIVGLVATQLQNNIVRNSYNSKTQSTMQKASITTLKDLSAKTIENDHGIRQSVMQTAVPVMSTIIEPDKEIVSAQPRTTINKRKRLVDQVYDDYIHDSTYAYTLQNDSQSQAHPLPVLIPGHTSELIDKMQPETSHENYLWLSSDRIIIGNRWFKPLSQRLSLGYGLGAGQSFYVSETNTVLSMPTLEIPVELRYYLIPREKRFTAFIYTLLNGSFTANTSQLTLITGAKAHYRLWQNSRSAAFLFADFPMYQRQLFPKSNPYQQPLH
ncbi:hypothetical protein QNI19_28910 [Cytophagaceae bacterium DM2B3-1]|uniref:Uncharacterized protein n=1 Tax=Xanthocytophaga flava TaxID=3048013 RepID=A0ABT7CTE0_9BACT|nr:hypothetical protein [Xanthocytophaga flavus]MDJ1496992.1 hypothetical protein [Xanthocytophaga flavus]